jgi:ABC-type spermidine/putrescine transport system permease subunit II
MIKKSKELPVINALSSIMLLFTFILVFASQRLTRPVNQTS